MQRVMRVCQRQLSYLFHFLYFIGFLDQRFYDKMPRIWGEYRQVVNLTNNQPVDQPFPVGQLRKSDQIINMTAAWNSRYTLKIW